MKTDVFCITWSNLGWINGPEDDPEDLCSHGEVTVHLGDEQLSYSCCTSAAALRMLRSLTEDHLMQDFLLGEQMLPCCGFNLYADNTLQNVFISGCPNGVDYEVRHQDDEVVIVTPAGNRYAVALELYCREVLYFARAVEDFYAHSRPKRLPEDELDRNGYLAFWNEWRRRMESAVYPAGADKLASNGFEGLTGGMRK